MIPSVSPTAITFSDLAPQASPGKKADLMLAGTAYPVTLSLQQKENEFTLNLISHGEMLESERYGLEGQTFGLLDAAEEHFKPMLPLLKFPLHSGDTWTWSGSLTTGGISKSASANVVIEAERIFVAGMSHGTMRSTVDISLQANPGKQPLQRQLIFWFEPKSGVIKRQFGTTSVRQPSQN